MASGIADNRTLSFAGVGAKKARRVCSAQPSSGRLNQVPALTKKAVIIMDEVHFYAAAFCSLRSVYVAGGWHGCRRQGWHGGSGQDNHP